MTTYEQFEALYRSAGPAVRQRLDDIITGATLRATEGNRGNVHHDSSSDHRPASDRGDMTDKAAQ